MKNTYANETKNQSKNISEDIIDMILEDHKPIKKHIKILKDLEVDIDERKETFESFASQLDAHAQSEERTLYEFMKKEDDLLEEALEGDVEHGLAKQLIEELKDSDDDAMWSAKAKVLAEMVEHHIEEEEEDIIPDFRKHSEKSERSQLGQEYMDLKLELESGDGVEVGNGVLTKASSSNGQSKKKNRDIDHSRERSHRD